MSPTLGGFIGSPAMPLAIVGALVLAVATIATVACAYTAWASRL